MLDMCENVKLHEIDFKEEIVKNYGAIVKKAKWQNKQIAVKIYPEFLIDYKWFKNRYAQLLEIDHENILKFYGTTEKPGQVMVLMEYAEGRSLYTHIHWAGVPNYTPKEALNWMLQFARGVGFLHALKPKPIYHGNLKPQNLFLTNNLRCLKVGELASGAEESCNDYAPRETRRKKQAYLNENNLTRMHTYFLNSIEYYYTEQYDVYSFGVVLWEVLFYMSALGPDMLGFKEMNSLIARCRDEHKNKRPTMEDVILNISIIARLYYDMDLDLGTTAANVAELQLGEVMGRGSFGIVLRANLFDIELAVKKILKSELNGNWIEREVRQLFRANHENIIKFFGSTQDADGNTLILMEYADCGSLHNYLYGNGHKKHKYTHRTVLNWMQQLAKGVAYLHDMTPKPVIHRDLKPHNLLLVNEFRTLKIADFGTVRDQATLMTDLIGTPEYMAPEVALGQWYTDKSDVYSFGIVLWEVLARKKPFYHLKQKCSLAIINLVTRGERPPLTDIHGIKYCEHFKSLIESCWTNDQTERLTMKDIIGLLNQ
ncbi:mitogen-activated protein kinase kinase kinase 7-like [Drosophila hydei]|uniref:Mitogen-activated protein kinase kinase kinase 7-like n=1 Tax=Drosophila hydei TaxID=7224 RepID=A0A6J1M5T1_DROHY|nr:mitogen-activated protein kinase kinase kinase 7-like [Drosophila hydei]